MKWNEFTERICKAKSIPEMVKALEDTNGSLEDIPILDLQPAVHAHWEDYVDSSQERVYGHSCYGVRCSHCKTDPNREYGLRGLKAKTPHCPKCGARMDGEGE